MKNSRPTIYEVARRCGVAPSTVSRTFGNPERVSAATRERVRAAAGEIGYQPRPLARADSPGRARALTLVVTDIANPYYAKLIKSAQARAIEYRYTMSLTDSDESPWVEANNLRHLLATSSGGILATSRLRDEDVLALARHRPLVLVNRRIEGLPHLIADTAGGVQKAVRHLAALGHRRLVYVSGPRNSWVNGERWRAVREEAAALGLHATVTGPFAPTRQGGHEAADNVILTGATAAITYNDLIAIGVLQRLRATGLEIPRDLSLVGCDDIFGADLTVPGLTTIAAPTEKLGSGAVDLLHAELDCTGEDISPAIFFETHLVVRASTGPAPFEDA